MAYFSILLLLLGGFYIMKDVPVGQDVQQFTDQLSSDCDTSCGEISTKYLLSHISPGGSLTFTITAIGVPSSSTDQPNFEMMTTLIVLFDASTTGSTTEFTRIETVEFEGIIGSFKIQPNFDRLLFYEVQLIDSDGRVYFGPYQMTINVQQGKRLTLQDQFMLPVFVLVIYLSLPSLITQYRRSRWLKEDVTKEPDMLEGTTDGRKKLAQKNKEKKVLQKPSETTAKAEKELLPYTNHSQLYR